jgi:hypothetical protein
VNYPTGFGCTKTLPNSQTLILVYTYHFREAQNTYYRFGKARGNNGRTQSGDFLCNVRFVESGVVGIQRHKQDEFGRNELCLIPISRHTRGVLFPLQGKSFLQAWELKERERKDHVSEFEYGRISCIRRHELFWAE